MPDPEPRKPTATLLIEEHHDPRPLRVAIEGGDVNIGRDKSQGGVSQGVVLGGGGVSFRHLTIREDKFYFGYKAIDHKSTNGTFVNGCFVKRIHLHNGDHIVLPQTSIRYFTGIRTRDELARFSYNELDDDIRLHLLETARGVFTVYRIENYNQLIEAFTGAALRGIAEHLSATLSDIFPMSRCELVSPRFDSILITSPFKHRPTAEQHAEALQRLATAALDGNRSVALQILHGESDQSSEVAFQQATPRQHSAKSHSRRNEKSEPVFSWVHISDLHVGAGTSGWHGDQEVVLAAMARDLEERAPNLEFDRIFVTGDLTFSGTSEQFAEAKNQLRLLATRCELGLSSVRIVPGNHDVQRSIASTPVLQALHLQARSDERALDRLLSDNRAKAVLEEELAAFSSFLAGLPGHPSADRALDWSEDIPVGNKVVRVHGLCSVWVSDEGDGVGGGRFTPNMLMAHRAVTRIMGKPDIGDATLVLTHHPVHWMMPLAQERLGDAIAASCGVHLCGHVHDARASVMLPIGGLSSATMVAGASHSDPGEPARHAYSWVQLAWSSKLGKWRLGWSPRVYVARNAEFRPDITQSRLDSDGFAWRELESRPRVSGLEGRRMETQTVEIDVEQVRKYFADRGKQWP